jgi:hypothetical protein
MHAPTCIFWANLTPFSPDANLEATGERRLLREQPALSDDAEEGVEMAEMLAEMEGAADADPAESDDIRYIRDRIDLAESDETGSDEPDAAADSEQPPEAAQASEQESEVAAAPTGDTVRAALGRLSALSVFL